MDSLPWQREKLYSENVGGTGDDVSSHSPRTISVEDFLLPGVDLSGQLLNHSIPKLCNGPSITAVVSSSSTCLFIKESPMTPLKGLGKEVQKSKEGQQARLPFSGNNQHWNLEEAGLPF